MEYSKLYLLKKRNKKREFFFFKRKTKNKAIERNTNELVITINKNKFILKK